MELIRVRNGASVMALLGLAAVCAAQQPIFKRTEIQRVDIAASGREAVMATVEVPPGLASGKHTHPGDEVGMVLEGAVILEIEGMPPATLKAGQPFHTPSGKVHNVRNTGTTMARLVTNFIVEKGKPLATPVP